jgi:hypothetical protein
VGTHLRTLQRDARFVRYADRIQKHLTRSIQTHTQAFFFVFSLCVQQGRVWKNEKNAFLLGLHWNEKRFLERLRVLTPAAHIAKAATGAGLHQEMISGQTRLHFMTLAPRKKV